MSRTSARRAAVLLAIGFGLAALGDPGPSPAEQVGGGGIGVSLDGGAYPRERPRDRPVPVSVRLAGKIWGTEGAPPPRLGSVSIAFGARGGLSTAALPRCPRSRLLNATRRQALARCRGAMVGRGRIMTEVPLAPDKPLFAPAGLLAFNGRVGGRPAVWVHAYSASPPVSFVIPFRLHLAGRGGYGVVLHAAVAKTLGRNSRLRAFDITLGRRYRAGGAWRSYLRAACPLPPRFTAATFPLARATYRFQSDRTRTVTILRGCRTSD